MNKLLSDLQYELNGIEIDLDKLYDKRTDLIFGVRKFKYGSAQHLKLQKEITTTYEVIERKKVERDCTREKILGIRRENKKKLAIAYEKLVNTTDLLDGLLGDYE